MPHQIKRARTFMGFQTPSPGRLGSLRRTGPLFVVAVAAVGIVAGLAPADQVETEETLSLLADSFEDANLDAENWTEARGVSIATDCGTSSGSGAATAGGDAPRRVLASRPVDADAGATISFAYTTGYTSGPLADECPAVDGADQGIKVQYSLDAGHTWHTIATLEPSPDAFTTRSLDVAANEGSEHTEIRWIQHQHDGTGTDVWAIDQVNVTTITDAEDPVLEANESDLGGLGPAAYAYQRTVIVNNTGDRLTHHPVEVTFDSQALIDAGKMQADCDDLRFTGDDDVDLLPHEVTDGCGNATTTAWVEALEVPTGNSTLHMHYGDVYGGQDAPVQPVNESDTTDPQPTTSLRPEQNLTHTTDNDGDDIPDQLEETLCTGYAQGIIEGGGLGACHSDTDWEPLEVPTPYTLRAPQWLSHGPDNDGDGFPATVSIEWIHVSVHRSDDHGPYTWNGGVTTHLVDPADDNSSHPSIDVVCNPIPRQERIGYGFDDDGDGVPGKFYHSGGDLCVDSTRLDGVIFEPARRFEGRTLDPDDADPTVPTTSLPSVTDIPTNATFDHDNDEDGLVDTRFLGRLDVTWDTTRNETNLHRSVEATSWDPDDEAHHEPWHLETDVDADGIPDSSERHVCEVQDERTRLDGYCRDLDTDFHPPFPYPSGFEPTPHTPPLLGPGP